MFPSKKQWDDRFIFSKMPSYDSESDPNLALHRNLRKLKQNSVFELKRANKQTRSSSFIGIPEKKLRFEESLIERLTESYYMNEVDEYFVSVFLDAIRDRNLKMRKEIIANEIEKVNSKQSKIQKALSVVKDRERMIKDIKTQIVSSNVNQKEVRYFFVDALARLRSTTVEAFESILEWKYYLGDLSGKYLIIEFLYQGENYYEKMKCDLSFLATCKLANVFCFSSKSDPFLEFSSQFNKKMAKDLEVIPMSNNEKSKISSLQLLFIQEATNLIPRVMKFNKFINLY